MFEITQTDPIEGADPLPSNPTQRLTGDHDHGVIAPLTAHLESSGWRVDREPLTHASGYTDPETRRVILADRISVEQSAKTLIHETAHIELHHIDSVEEYRLHRGRMEVEAESVAYVVAGLHGFDTSSYSIGYITGWSDEDITVIRDTASRVLAAAHKIAETLNQ
ncbi:ImmA/IrrE family metallo-endopeptidase [Leifsonia sp. TF02-11]|uniref:ImmA/IrrE family metallo-endopeptidase n=1 Tax=Leifsonia sp. TF02-11 TaxID=2815212 RepID=UPI0027DC5E02|nr:ImmA/IrrE family metallo-endopeptidase [Leifsonia sp. TF02-11]